MKSQDSPGPVLPTYKTTSAVKMVIGAKQRQNTRFAQFKLQGNVKGQERGSTRAMGCQASAGNTHLCPVLQGLEQEPIHTCLPDAGPSGLALTARGDLALFPAQCTGSFLKDGWPPPPPPGSGPSSGKPSWLPPSAASLCDPSPHCILARHHPVSSGTLVPAAPPGCGALGSSLFATWLLEKRWERHCS